MKFKKLRISLAILSLAVFFGVCYFLDLFFINVIGFLLLACSVSLLISAGLLYLLRYLSTKKLNFTALPNIHGLFAVAITVQALAMSSMGLAERATFDIRPLLFMAMTIPTIFVYICLVWERHYRNKKE